MKHTKKNNQGYRLQLTRVGLPSFLDHEQKVAASSDNRKNICNGAIGVFVIHPFSLFASVE